MVLRYASAIFVAMILATVVALFVSAVEPKKVEAASALGTCSCETIQLNAREERTLRLHNQARKSRD